MNTVLKMKLEEMNRRLNEYEFYDPEYERSVMFPNGEDEEEDDFM